MYDSFLIHSSADGHLGCFHVLAIINSAVMNIEVHVSLSILVSSVCMLLHCWWECKLVQPLWRTVWRFLKKLQIELPIHFYFPYYVELFSFNCSCSHVIKANQELYLFSFCFFTILITVAFIFAFSDFPEHQNWLINVVFLTLFVELHS